MKEHWKRHGGVHCFWVVVALVICICWLIVQKPDSDKLLDFFNFSVAVSSLFLAIVAIFYSIVSNQSFSETVGVLRSSADQAAESSGNIGSASQTLLSLTQDLARDIAELKPKFDDINTKIERGLSPASAAYKPMDNLNSSNKTSGLAIALYSIIKMSESDSKEFNPRDAFSTVKWQYFIGGCMSAIAYFEPMGISINRIDGGYSLKSLGGFSEEKFRKEFDFDKLNKPMKKLADDYFSMVRDDTAGDRDAEESDGDWCQSRSQPCPPSNTPPQLSPPRNLLTPRAFPIQPRRQRPRIQGGIGGACV